MHTGLITGIIPAGRERPEDTEPALAVDAEEEEEEEEEEGGIPQKKKANSMSSPCINMTASILPGVAGGHGWGGWCAAQGPVSQCIILFFYLKECFKKLR